MSACWCCCGGGGGAEEGGEDRGSDDVKEREERIDETNFFVGYQRKCGNRYEDGSSEEELNARNWC